MRFQLKFELKLKKYIYHLSILVMFFFSRNRDKKLIDLAFLRT